MPEKENKPDFMSEVIRARVEKCLDLYFSSSQRHVESFPIGGLAGSDYMLKLQSVRHAAPETLGTSAIGQSSHHATSLNLQLSLVRSPLANQEDVPNLLTKAAKYSTTAKFAQILAPSVEQLEYNKSHGDNSGVNLEIAIMAKGADILPHIAWAEVDGYSKLAKIGVPTLCCILPPKMSQLGLKSFHPDIRDNAVIVTLFEHGLNPCNFYPDLAGKNQHIWENLWKSILSMHSHGFIHGDSKLKNYGQKGSTTFTADPNPETLLVLDPEARVDFSQFDAIDSSDYYSGSKFLHTLQRELGYENMHPVVFMDLMSGEELKQRVLEVAMLLDLDELLGSTSPANRGVDPLNPNAPSKSASKAWEIIADTYLNPLLKARKVGKDFHDRARGIFDYWWK